MAIKTKFELSLCGTRGRGNYSRDIGNFISISYNLIHGELPN